MPRRPEIGSVQLYPNRPLKKSDKNGYVLKFYCPIKRKRIRRNCGTRDKREARKILRECRERLLNGEYERSGGAITSQHVVLTMPISPSPEGATIGKSWQECVERYRQHQKSRIRNTSLEGSILRLNVAERIFDKLRQVWGISEGIPVREVMTLDMLELLQDRLLAGDECRYDQRSPNSVNSHMEAIMAFVRFCHARGWIDSVPNVQKIRTDDVKKGRPTTTEEFEQMLSVTSKVVGRSVAESWQLALKVLWESGFRVGDLMDFHWEDDRHIHPCFPIRKNQLPTIIIPSTQKNGRVQEIPMLPGLQRLLTSIPKRQQTSWVVNPLPMEYRIEGHEEWFRPTPYDMMRLVKNYSNCAIADACNVSNTTIRKWLEDEGIQRQQLYGRRNRVISDPEVKLIRGNSKRYRTKQAEISDSRLTTERVGRVISLIGKEAGVLVQRADGTKREKYASAHDLRRGCALRLINAGVSAETLKIVMRHKNFSTTEKHYGAFRSAQSAANEIAEKLAEAHSVAFVGGIKKAPQLCAEELSKLKSLLNSI